MPEPPNDPLLGSFVAGVWLLGIGVWIYLLSTWRRKPFLPYEPRRPVPWGPWAALLAALFTLAQVSSYWGSDARQEPLVPPDLAHAMIFQVLMVGVFLCVVIVISKPTASDLGLPNGPVQFAGDIFIGIVASLAAIVPVDTIMAVLKFMFHQQHEMSQHELVKMITEGEPDVGVLVMATLAAVVVAPICEEITFRLLLQGWLEKWEDARLGWRVDPSISIDGDEMTNDEARMIVGELDASGNSSFVIGHSEFPTEPPSRGMAGLPHGWLPILISSLLFAAAHFGYGPEPVPLFFLAIFLGYLYQRTHRIVPCIMVHALFNAFTMVLLWRIVFHPAE